MISVTSWGCLQKITVVQDEVTASSKSSLFVERYVPRKLNLEQIVLIALESLCETTYHTIYNGKMTACLKQVTNMRSAGRMLPAKEFGEANETFKRDQQS